MSLPRMVRQYVIILRAQTRSGHHSADDAGRKLADYLTEKYPSLARAVLVNWCTARFRKHNPLPEGWISTIILPPKYWSLPLSDAVKYHEERRAMAGRFDERTGEQGDLLALLTQAAHGDMSMTVEDAYRLAHPEEQAI